MLSRGEVKKEGMARGREGDRESEVSLKLRKEGISKSRSGQKSQSIPEKRPAMRSTGYGEFHGLVI